MCGADQTEVLCNVTKSWSLGPQEVLEGKEERLRNPEGRHLYKALARMVTLD